MIRLLAAFALVTAVAGFARGAGPGTAAGTFLTVPVGGRQIGMGGAYTALADDAYAPYYNPGGLGRVGAPEVAFQYNEFIVDFDQQYLAMVYPFSKGALGIAWTRFDFGSLDRTLITSGTTFQKTGVFDASSNALGVSYGHRVSDRLSLGAQAKYIHEEIAEFEANAFAFDFGGTYEFIRDQLLFAATVQNLGNELEFIGRADRLPRLSRVGLAYTTPSKRLNLAIDLERAVNSGAIVRIGAEYWIASFFAIRGGYDSTSEVGENFAAGLGVKNDGLAIDYAYTDEDLFGKTHRISAAYKFRKPREEDLLPKPPPVVPEEPVFIEAKVPDRQLTNQDPQSTSSGRARGQPARRRSDGERMLELMQLGDRYHRNGLYRSAAEKFRKALEIQPDNTWVLFRLASAHFEDHEYDEAARLFTKVIEIEPDNVTARIYIGNSYCALGLTEEADAAWRNAGLKMTCE